MVKNKTTQTEFSVDTFIETINDSKKRNDCSTLITILKSITSLEPKMWGPSIVGFGSHHYKYESGREGDSPNFGFSPRAASIALYFAGGFENREELLAKLGKHKTEKGCVHIKSIDDIDMDILQIMIVNHLKYMTALYP
jgi:hypothetical protein